VEGDDALFVRGEGIIVHFEVLVGWDLLIDLLKHLMAVDPDIIILEGVVLHHHSVSHHVYQQAQLLHFIDLLLSDLISSLFQLLERNHRLPLCHKR
jgi:hypothetical protein